MKHVADLGKKILFPIDYIKQPFDWPCYCPIKKNSNATKPTRMLLVSLMEIIEVYGEKEETNGEKGKKNKNYGRAEPSHLGAI